MSSNVMPERLVVVMVVAPRWWWWWWEEDEGEEDKDDNVESMLASAKQQLQLTAASMCACVYVYEGAYEYVLYKWSAVCSAQ